MARKRGPRETTGCDPAVVALYRAINETPLTVGEIAYRAGLNENTIWTWLGRKPPVPNIANLRAVLNALGYEIQVVRKS